MDNFEKEINPFEHSLQKLQEELIKRNPEHSLDIINESVEFIFYKKFEQAETIKESPTVIEDGDETIKNGRRLMKEDFTYNFAEYGLRSKK